MKLSGFALVLPLLISQASAQSGPSSIRTYRTIRTTELKAHIFLPSEGISSKPRPAIVLLHGGGWSAGSPEWVYGDAARFAGSGMVAIAGQYRLSDQKEITPLEAMSDVRMLIRWVRSNATDLNINPHRVAVYGYSAGGHLAVSAAVFSHPEEDRISAAPDALILLSPAASIIEDKWPGTLLGTRGNIRDISPAEQITRRLPPTIIIEGSADTETPLPRVTSFCESEKRAGGICELHVYPGLGHILSRNLDPRAQEQGPFDPDPPAVEDAHAKEHAFLARLGFIR